jgi:bacillopeptidase F (M6 metalloprotease family)
VVDLTAYAGQTINLRLQFTTDSSDQSSLYLDDLAFESGP